MEKKSSINKETQRESGGRDGNGKKDEVSPMGEARLLSPSTLLLSSFLHLCSFQGEMKEGEIKKEEPARRGKVWHQWWHQDEERSEVKQMIVCFHRKGQESLLLEFMSGEDLEGEDFWLRLFWPVLMGHPWVSSGQPVGYFLRGWRRF